jgi:hypothetical protein
VEQTHSQLFLVIKPSHPRLGVKWKMTGNNSTHPPVQSHTTPKMGNTLPITPSLEPEVGFSSTFAAMALCTKQESVQSPSLASPFNAPVASESKLSSELEPSLHVPQLETPPLPQDTDMNTLVPAQQKPTHPHQIVRGRKRQGPPGWRPQVLDIDLDIKNTFNKLADELMSHPSFPLEPHHLLPEDYGKDWEWLHEYQ